MAPKIGKKRVALRISENCTSSIKGFPNRCGGAFFVREAHLIFGVALRISVVLGQFINQGWGA